MKKKNYILFTIGILLIAVMCFIGIITNTKFFKNEKENKESTNVTYQDRDDLTNEEIAKNTYDKVLKIGDTVDIKTIIDDKDTSTLKYISNSDETVAIVQENQITALTDGKTEITYKIGEEQITVDIEVESARSNASSNEKSAGQIYFLNTQKPGDKTSNESVLIKGTNGEYVLLDTSNQIENDKCPNLIKSIQHYANSKKVTLKYVIISHYHKDHYICYEPLIKDGNIKVENVILKDTNISHDIYIKLKKASQNKDINVIKINNKSEGTTIKLGNTKLYLYNTDDVFEKNACNKKIKTIKFKSAEEESELKNSLKTKNGEYFIMKDPNSTTYTTTSSKVVREKKSSVPKSNNKLVFYAQGETGNDNCNENSNSIAILVDFQINGNDHRYAYLPSDLENNGYPVWGAYNKTVGRILYGSGTSYEYTINDNKIVAGSNNIYNAAEYRTAKDVKEKVGAKNLSKISIYLQTHHGYNNALDALETLDFDKARPANYPLYAIATLSKNSNKAIVGFLTANSYMKLYNATNKGKNNLATGVYTYGITCNVTVSGATSCIGDK